MPTGYTTVSSTHLSDSTGALVANATITFKPVDNHGNPVSFLVSSIGLSVGSSVTTQVVNGAFSIELADTSLTTPVNVGYAVTLKDNTSGNPLPLIGYGCFQPVGVAIAFDQTPPNLAAQITVQTDISSLNITQIQIVDSVDGTIWKYTVQAGVPTLSR